MSKIWQKHYLLQLYWGPSPTSVMISWVIWQPISGINFGLISSNINMNFLTCLSWARSSGHCSYMGGHTENHIVSFWQYYSRAYELNALWIKNWEIERQYRFILCYIWWHIIITISNFTCFLLIETIGTLFILRSIRENII